MAIILKLLRISSTASIPLDRITRSQDNLIVGYSDDLGRCPVRDFYRLKIVSKRQITLPQLMLEKLHLQEGDELEVEVEDGNILAVRPLKLVPADFFTDTMLRQLQERSKSMDAGHKTREVKVQVVKLSGKGLGAKAAQTAARAAAPERSAGGD